MRGWRPLARLPPALLLATGKDPLCSEYLTAAIVSGAAVVSIDHEFWNFADMRAAERGFDRDLNSFVQAYGSKRLDASLLLIPIVGFLPPEDPRVHGTLRAIEDRLLIDGEFLLRYETEHAGDGLPAGEGAFLACSFWLVDNYILQGRDADARKLFARLLSRRNDVGLLAEELDPLTGRMLGNFPQAYSHVGLINCVLNLSRQKGPAEERAESQGPPITVASTRE
jgi:hypothetical protein